MRGYPGMYANNNPWPYARGLPDDAEDIRCMAKDPP